jgi:hypothetical protein
MSENQQIIRPLRLNLPKRTVRRLEEVGIYCRSDVRLEYQQLGKRYVVLGTESGGAIREIGRYMLILLITSQYNKILAYSSAKEENLCHLPRSESHCRFRGKRGTG